MKSEPSAILITRSRVLNATLWRQATHTTSTISRVFPNGASKLIRGVARLLIFVAATRSASAGWVPSYYDRESWMAAQGEATFSSFETSDAPLGLFTPPSFGFWEDQGVRFTEIYGGIGLVTGDQYNNGFNLAETWGVDPSTHTLRAYGDAVRWDVTVPTTSIAIECAVLGGLFIHYECADGTFGRAWFVTGWDPAYPSKFCGLVASAPIVRVNLYLGDELPGGNYRSYLKSFSFGNPIPEPPVAILFLGGLIGMSRRRS